ncbi:MAG: DNA translocase FtsK [Akkermansia sp.]|nr:DNA translocase FtsK [Akkermansia sp.]
MLEQLPFYARFRFLTYFELAECRTGGYHICGAMYQNPIYDQPEPKIWPTRVAGAGVILVSLLLALALYSYNINEVGWAFLNPKGAAEAAKIPCTNALGVVGLYLAGLLYAFLGAGAVYLLFLLPILGIAMMMYPEQRRVKQWIALIVMLISACSALSIQPWILTEWATKLSINTPGGTLGYLDGKCVVEELAGTHYGITLLVLIHALAVIYFARLTPQDVCKATQKDLGTMYANWREKRRLRKEALEEADREWQMKGQAIAQLGGMADEPRYRKQSQLPLEVDEPMPRQQQPLTHRREVEPPLPQQHLPQQRQMPVARPMQQEDDIDLPKPFNEQLEDARRNDRNRVVTQAPPTARKRNAPTISSNRDNLLDLMRPIEEAIENNSRMYVEGPSREQLPHNERLMKEIERKTRQHRTPEPEQTTQPSPAPAPAPRREPTPQAPTATPRKDEKPRKAASPAPLPEDTREQYDDYPLPPYDLLAYRPEPPEVGIAAREEMYDMQQRIVETLENFKITVEPGDITRGPSITRYEFFPPRGLRVNRISNLSSDLMLATESKSVNILAPIPGKNTVGVELENATKSPVYLRELLQSEAFHNPKLRIPVALGKDVYGNAVIGDLAAMPHTLVAGTTGSGKSVCINSMILSMLYKFRPDELRLILVDPKVVEMQPYKKLPHLACPVVTNPARVIGALRWAVNEMEHRYKLFSKIGVRNFEDFNNRPADYEPEPEEDEFYDDDQPIDYAAIEAMASEIERPAEEEIPLGEEEQDEFDFEEDERIPSKLPYIVIFIDELADLMMVVKEDLENYIARLTQKARAAGIHLVVATQTPRANVVTGMIKANIPSRIALKVSSPLDSRIILDMTGAENLLGKGDFLFLPPAGITKLTRAQGAFVSDAEIASIIKFCASHAKQNFEQGVTAEMNNSDNAAGVGGGGDNGGRIGGKGVSDEDAELYTRCVNLVVSERKASTSLLQRRFSIGYGRAAKIMDMMEERGVISPPQGATRAREVLIDAP